MKIKNLFKRVIALAIFVGALPFVFNASAREEDKGDKLQLTGDELEVEQKKESKWLDDYHKKVGFTYGAKATIQTTYIWRGLYSGGANIQASANVGYGGLYLDMWWNIGVTDWSFKQFQPEVDLSLGFARWGLNVYLLYIHNFNKFFFDFNNYAGKGNRLELNVRYTVSSKLPLSFIWGTRLSAADGYIDEETGKLVRAYSSYAEISYTHRFPYDISLYGALGITPWRSVYTHYKGGFAFQNIDIRLMKEWEISTHCGLRLMGQLTINPSGLAADKSTAQWKPLDPGWQSINGNLACCVYLK